MNELLVLFGSPCGSAAALLGGVLPLRYCSGRFLHVGFPLGVFLLVAMFSLVAEFAGVMEVLRDEHVGRAQLPGLVGGSRVLSSRRILRGVKRVRLH